MRLDSPDKEIVSHSPPILVAKGVGKFQAAAAIGKELRSEVITLEILGSETANTELTADPEAITLRVGERTPAITVNARDAVGGSSRPVDVQWTSEDEAIAAPDQKLAGRFLCQAVGKTVLTGSFGDQKVSVAVNVLGNPFDEVRLKPQAIWKSSDEFQVVASIHGTGKAASEYRVVDGNHSEDSWKPATTDGDSVKVELTSPVLRHGTPDTIYHLTIECRDKQRHAAERFPLSFKIAPGTVEQQSGGDGKASK